MTVLLDSSVLIPLIVEDHTHHAAAETWFAALATPFATCPITQGSLVRFLIRGGVSSTMAVELMESITSSRHHEFWADHIPYSMSALRGVVGHRQVTDAYLVALARYRGGLVATFDAGLASLHADVSVLVSAR